MSTNFNEIGTFDYIYYDEEEKDMVRGEAYITESEGLYQVSLDDEDDYMEFSSVKECFKYVEEFYNHFYSDFYWLRNKGEKWKAILGMMKKDIRS